MELIIKAVEVESWNRIKIFNAIVNEENYRIARANQELQKEKLINSLKRLKSEGLIKSIFIPKNKKIQEELNKIVTTKKLIKKEVSRMKTIFN